MPETNDFETARILIPVEQLFGMKQRKLTSTSLSSVTERNFFASYHYHEAHKIIGAQSLSVDDALEDMDDDKKRMQAKAHIVACISNLHALGDTISFLIYAALKLEDANPKKRTKNQVSLKNVITWLPAGEIKSLLKQWLDSDEIQYVVDLNNQAKHQNVFEVSRRVSISEDKHGLRFAAFQGKTTAYPENWVSDRIFPANRLQVDLLRQLLLELENTLCSMLSNRSETLAIN